MSSLLDRTLQQIRAFHPLYRLRQISWGHRIIRACDIPIRYRTNGLERPIWLRLFRYASLIGNSEVAESDVLTTLARILKTRAKWVFWDVGANIGFFSWWVKEKSPQSQIVMFEPDPINVDLLRRTLKSNALDGIVLDTRAVSDCDGVLDFTLDHLSGVTGTIVRERPTADQLLYGCDEKSTVPVKSVPLDHATDYPAPDLLKIDVEGAELKVLKGGAELLPRTKPIIFLEIADRNVPPALEALRSYGYTTLQFVRQSRSAVGDYIAIPVGGSITTEFLMSTGVPLAAV